ncbi:hypothetical protein [Natrinema halophilum]|uniref:hypothetical protein n=1 Tax=Natrinema halophilum TaxID=1699371 RepID=UPI0031BB0356
MVRSQISDQTPLSRQIEYEFVDSLEQVVEGRSISGVVPRDDVLDRRLRTGRTELSGNISLNQELTVIKRVNEWIDAGHLPESEFSKTAIRRLTMERTYHCSTKVDRSPTFIRELMALGEEHAAAFLEAGPPDESEYTVSEPHHSPATR